MNLSTHLSKLEHAQLVRALDDRMIAYLFKHVLVQETTYASLLKHDRQRLHRAVARTLEEAEPEQLDENAARLSQHFAEAGDDAKTLEYTMRAGDYAASLYANAEAIQHYERALVILARRGGTTQEYLNVYMRRGRALELMGFFPHALENYLRLEEEGVKQGDSSLELSGLLARATIYATPTSVHDTSRGQALNARALELARQLGDQTAECKTLWNLLLIAYFNSEPERAVAFGEQALRLARQLGLEEREAYILNDMSRPMISIGPIARSIESLDRARVLFQAHNNLPMLADNLAATGETLLMAGKYDRALEFTEQAIALNRRINNTWGLAYSGFALSALNIDRGNLDTIFKWTDGLNSVPEVASLIMFIFGARAWRSEAFLMLGDLTRAVAESRELEELAKSTWSLGQAWLKANVVHALVAAGELDEAQRVLREGYQEKLGEYSAFAPILIRLADAELALALHNPAHAVDVLDSLLFDLERLDIHFHRVHAFHLRGMALVMQGALDDAVRAFEQAREFGELIPARRVLWETYARWAEVETRRGNHVRADELWVRAREYVWYIADHTGNAERRAQFLRRPAIQAVLQSSDAADI